MTDNPLSQYFTQTGMYVALPSNGRFYKNPLKTSADGEIEIFPMNALDELQMQNPDGLLNNESLIKVFQHICPGIPDPREIPRPDLDVLMLAMRIVTYDKMMDVNVTCSNPECKHEMVMQVDLQRILSNAKKIPEDTTVKIGDLVVHLRPYSLQSQNRLNEYLMNVQRAARMMQNSSNDQSIDREALIDQIKKNLGDNLMKGATELFNIAGDSIEKIVTPDGQTVTDQGFINEWLNKLKAPQYKKLKDRLTEISEEVVDREFTYTCEKCEKNHKVEINFDPANFFDLN